MVYGGARYTHVEIKCAGIKYAALSLKACLMARTDLKIKSGCHC